MNLDLPHHSHHLINGRARGGPWLNNSDYLSMRESLLLTSAYVRPPAQTLGDGEKSPKATRKGGGGGVGMPSSSLRELNRAVLFWQPALA